VPDEKDPTRNADPAAEPGATDAPAPGAPIEPAALDEAKAAMEADADAPAEGADSARPEAIARRVAALGEEDETEKLARAEEEKLAARRREQRKGKKKGGLEAAASKRLAKIGANAPVKRSVATAADAEPFVDRATQFSEWAKKNQTLVGLVAAAVVVGAGALGVYTYMQHQRDVSASVALAKAVADERGRIGDPEKEEDPNQPKDPRPIFKTTDDRRAAALREYQDVETRFKGTGAAILARLSEGALLLDKRDVPGAIAAFTEVQDSLLAHADAEVRGRALEGQGFAYELKAEDLPADQKGAVLDDALKSFRALENTDVEGFKELGMYHQARVYETKGDKAKAIELLKSLRDRVNKPEDSKNHPYPYLQEVVDDRLRALDPAALPPKAPPNPFGGPGGAQPTDAQIRKMIEQQMHNRGGK